MCCGCIGSITSRESDLLTIRLGVRVVIFFLVCFFDFISFTLCSALYLFLFSFDSYDSFHMRPCPASQKSKVKSKTKLHCYKH